MRGRKVTQADTERILQLCQLICQEQNPSEFQKLVAELNQFLAQKEQNPKKALLTGNSG